MHRPPDPEMRSPGVGSARAKSQSLIINAAEHNQACHVLQARKLRRLFFLAHDTAVTVASLAWGCAR